MIKIEFNLGELPGAAVFIMERSWRMLGKRHRWRLDPDMRILGKVFAALAQQLRAEVKRREHSPASPAARIAFSDISAERAHFLSLYFAAESERLIEIRSRQKQSPLEMQLADLKACAMDVYGLDCALARAFAETAQAGAGKLSGGSN